MEELENGKTNWAIKEVISKERGNTYELTLNPEREDEIKRQLNQKE